TLTGARPILQTHARRGSSAVHARCGTFRNRRQDRPSKTDVRKSPIDRCQALLPGRGSAPEPVVAPPHVARAPPLLFPRPAVAQAPAASAVRELPHREGDRCGARRSEEHTSELQSRENLVCRLL